jgi:hypothetical protein
MPLKYLELLKDSWDEKQESREQHELEPGPQLVHDPVDELPEELKNVDFSKVRLEFMRFIAYRAGIVIFDENRYKEKFNSELETCLRILLKKEENGLEENHCRFNFVRNYVVVPGEIQAINLAETAVKAFSIAYNFGYILRANGYNAFLIQEIQMLKGILSDICKNGQYEDMQMLPSVVSHFHTILTPMNKLLVFKLFAIRDFGDELDDVESNEENPEELSTLIATHDYTHLLSQMYYLQPERIIRIPHGFNITW